MPGSTEKTSATRLLYMTTAIRCLGAHWMPKRGGSSGRRSLGECLRGQVQREREVLRSRTRRQSLEKSDPMVGQTWTMDGEDVLITDLVVEMTSQAIHRLEVRKRDGAVCKFPLGEFLSRAVYREG